MALLWAAPLLSHPAVAQEPSDTVSLNEVEVTAHRSSLSPGRSVHLSQRSLSDAVGLLGETDYMAALKTFGGISGTGSDYGAGASIDGYAPGHTLYRLDGAPVFSPYHFGGIYSTFSANHITSASLHRNSPDALGGTIDFSSVSRRREGKTLQLNAGMLAPSASIAVPLGKEGVAAVSGRISLLDELYPWLMNSLDEKMSYRFHDINATVAWRGLKASFFTNSDRLGISSPLGLSADMAWENTVASFSYAARRNKADWDVSAWWSATHNSVNAAMSALEAYAPSSLWQAGLKGSALLHNLPLTLSLDAEYTSGSPQATASAATQQSFKTSATPAWSLALPHNWNFTLSPTLTLYKSEGDATLFFSPAVAIEKEIADNGTLTLSAAVKRQYLHKVGFSEIGMASDFLLPATAATPPSVSKGGSVSWTHRFGGNFTARVEAFGSRIEDEADLSASMLSLLDESYNPYDYLSSGKGWNTGINADAQYSRGPLSAHASFSWTLSRRKYPGYARWTDSPWSQPLALCLNGSYGLSEKWSLSAVLNARSGRPVTPIKSVYIISNRLIATYGDRNSKRLSTYCRLDIGADYRFRSNGGKVSHKLSIAVDNALGILNEEMNYFHINAKEGLYKVKHIRSIIRFLPSLSYSVSL